MGVHAFEEELGCADGDFGGGLGVDFEGGEFFEESLDLLQLFEGVGCCLSVVELDGAAEVEPLLDLLGVGAGEVLVEDGGDAGADDLADDGVGSAHLAFVLEFDFAGDAGECGVDIAYAGDGEGFAVEEGAAFGVGDDEFHGGDGEALGDAAALVDFLIFPSCEGDLLDDLADVVGDFDVGGWAGGPGFLGGDGEAFFDVLGVVGADLAADAVFEGGDDLAAGGVVLGVGGEDDGDVEGEADGVALNLDVAFLHDVEEGDLDFSGEVGDFVDGEDAAVGAGEEAVVHGEFGAEVLIGAGGFDGVDVADEIGYGDVGGGELFDIAVVGGEPGDGGFVAEFGDEVFRELGDGGVGIVAEFGAGDVGAGGVEQGGEGAEDAGFGLAAEAEEDEVVFGEDGVDDLGDDGVFVADDAGEERNFGFGGVAQAGDEVLAELVFDGAGEASGGKGRVAESTEGLGK